MFKLLPLALAVVGAYVLLLAGVFHLRYAGSAAKSTPRAMGTLQSAAEAAPVSPLLFNAIHNKSIEGAVLARCNTFGELAALYSKPGKLLLPIWKYFPEHIWKTEECGLNYVYRAGRCMWCASNNASDCRFGQFRIHLFRDDNRAYSLETRGTLDLVAMRANHYTRNGKAEIDQVYVTCSNLNAALPPNVLGVLRVEQMPDFVHPVSALRTAAAKRRSKTAVCTKAFYGRGVNLHTVLNFVTHYLENWRFDYVIMYELGTTVGVLLKDVIASSARLLRYQAEGRIILLDLRPALQSTYGSIAKDLVLFSSKNGQLLVSSDCINQAKAVYTDISWVLLVDWDEILATGPYRKEPITTFADFAKEKSQFYRRKGRARYEVDILEFHRHRAADESICELCDDDNALAWDQDSWQDYARKFESKRFTNASMFTETAKKYAVRIDENQIYPNTWTYGVHDMSARCSFAASKEAVKYPVAIHDVYIRHFKCMNKVHCADKFTRIGVDWPLNFGSAWD